MSISRRRLLTGGLVATAGAAGATFAARNGLIPPDAESIWGLGESLNYATHRVLAKHALAREFSRAEISSKPFQNETSKPGPDYARLEEGKFAGWRLQVDGLVERPLSLTIEDVKRLPVRSQITQIACEEGWSYVAEWTGAPLSEVLQAAGIKPEARYVAYFSMDRDWWDSLDLDEALHPQTLVSYEMNGAPLSSGFGAPLRLRVPRQLGYKSVKYLTRLTVAASLKEIGTGLGSSSPSFGYAWYAGI